MPTNLVKTKADETKWNAAKEAVEKNGKKPKDFWAVVVHVFQNMKGKKDKKK